MWETTDRELCLLATRARVRGRVVSYGRKCAARCEAHRRGLYRTPTAQERAEARAYNAAKLATGTRCVCLVPYIAPTPQGVIARGAVCQACKRTATPRAVLVSTGHAAMVGHT